MGCGCAERRAKMKAWVKKHQQKRIAARLAKKKAELEALMKQKQELDNAGKT